MVKDEKIAHEVSAFTFFPLKADEQPSVALQSTIHREGDPPAFCAHHHGVVGDHRDPKCRVSVTAKGIVGAVALSLGASFGLPVLIWRYVLGVRLHWMVLPMSMIVLLAVGSD